MLVHGNYTAEVFSSLSTTHVSSGTGSEWNVSPSPEPAAAASTSHVALPQLSPSVASSPASSTLFLASSGGFPGDTGQGITTAARDQARVRSPPPRAQAASSSDAGRGCATPLDGKVSRRPVGTLSPISTTFLNLSRVEMKLTLSATQRLQGISGSSTHISKHAWVFWCCGQDAEMRQVGGLEAAKVRRYGSCRGCRVGALSGVYRGQAVAALEGADEAQHAALTSDLLLRTIQSASRGRDIFPGWAR